MSELDRFLDAQEQKYEIALKEIKNGKKISCWMWYIFPQIEGLGMTQISKKYSIKNIEEAIEYLNNEILRNRLLEISQALLDLGEVDIHEVMGFPDDLKLKSSMTLFKKAEELSDIKCDNIFQNILNQFYKGEDDQKTLTILEKQKFEKMLNAKKENNNENENGKTIRDIDIDDKVSNHENENRSDQEEINENDEEKNNSQENCKNDLDLDSLVSITHVTEELCKVEYKNNKINLDEEDLEEIQKKRNICPCPECLII